MVGIKNRPRWKFIVSLFLVVMILTAYWQLPSHEFLEFDDNEHIIQNAHVHKGITLENIAWAFSITDVAYWQPLTWVSHMLAYQLFGLKSEMHHLMNLFLHMASSLLLFLVLNRMTGALWQSAFVAAVFALHPLNVESVAWASERKNVLSTFFWMLTLSTYAAYAERPNINRYLLILLVFALGLMAKPMLVTLPFVLLLLDYWPLCRFNLNRSGSGGQEADSSLFVGKQRTPVLRLLLEKIPLLILSAGCIYLSSLSMKHLGIVISTSSVPMELRIANALVSYLSYIKKMVWPLNLAVYYPYPQALPWWQIAGSGFFLVCVSIISLYKVKEKPYIATGWFWYIGTLVPAIGLVQAGLWPAIADRFTYVPLIGLFMIFAWGVSDIFKKWYYGKIFLVGSSIVILSALAWNTFHQLSYWKNGIALFENAVSMTENSCLAHNNLGTAYGSVDLDRAIYHYKAALKIKPDYVVAHYNLGNVLEKKGHTDEAIAQYLEALRIKPDFAEAHNNLGTALSNKKDYEGAALHFSKALKINPRHAGARNNLANVLLTQGKVDEAVLHYKEAIRTDPKYSNAYYNLGNILLKQGKTEEAFTLFSEAIKMNPDYVQAYNKVGLILFKLGKNDQAKVFFSQAIKINPNDDEARKNLGLVNQTLKPSNP
jgi:protein O-mannosyl-transferase